MYPPLSRRQMLSSTLASSSLGLALQCPMLGFAQSAAPTPECHDGHEATIRQTEGPYFKPSSPQRADLVESETKGQLVEITGQVLTRSCRPVERALVDLWHADEHGEYDNAGIRYRGHIFTDGEGCFRTNSQTTQAAAARAGYGVALLPKYIVATHEPELVEVPLGARLPEREVWLLVRRNLKNVARVRAVTDYLVEVFKGERRLLSG